MKAFIEKLIKEIKEWSFEAEIVIPTSDGYEDTVSREIVCTKNVIEIVNELAEEYNNGWIPCSERLPEKDMWCLATFESGGIDKIQYLFLQRWWNGEMGGNRVVAWQPLPTPYKEGE